MHLKSKLIRSRLDKKAFRNLHKISGSTKAGYPKENPASNELDTNGFSALQKAYAINYANKDYIPFLEIAFLRNEKKYKELFVKIAKGSTRNLNKGLEKLGQIMVKDIQNVLKEIQFSPTSNKTGCIFGAVSFVRVAR